MARRKKHPGERCGWSLDTAYGESWDTDCGNKFQFTEGGPRENGMHFCCYCGRGLRAIGSPQAEDAVDRSAGDSTSPRRA